MATGRGAVEAYLDVSPMQAWDRDQWDEYDATIDIGFHGPSIHFTPLLNYVRMPPGANTWYTGNELLPTHVNHEPIGLRQQFIDAMYVDMRRKKLVSNRRYGGKVQLHEFDELVSRFGKGTPQFMLNVLRTRLLGGITTVHEMIARDAIIEFALHKYLADGNAWDAGTYDFSTIATTSAWKFDMKLLEEVRLRLAERSMDINQRWGTYAQPVPNWPGDILAITTPGVMYDIWNTDEGQFMRDLRELQDQRIINGGVARWRGITFVETMDAVLWNAGTITKQVAVTRQIKWGDGAPDPDTETAVDNVYLVGQSSSDVTHYVQCTSFSASDFKKGDRVTIHTSRTSDFGITDGVDFLHGKSLVLEIYEVDAANNRIKFRWPITEEYRDPFSYSTLGGSSSSGTAYAFITKAQHIHPVFIIGSRGMATFAARTKIRIHNPTDDHVDLPGIIRVTWDEYGQANRWNPDIYEIIFCAASSTRSGRDKAQIL